MYHQTLGMMPIYMDRHDIPGVTAEAVAEAHQEDLKIQEQFNCKGLTYWFDKAKGMAFCLIEAPDKQSVQDLHNYAHGLIPNKIIEVESALVESFLGRIEDPDQDSEANLPVINDPAFRVVMVAVNEPTHHNASATHQPHSASEMRSAQHLFKEVIEEHSGQLVEHDQTFLMASFKSARNSVQSAMEFQKRIRSDSSLKAAPNNRWRIGLGAGVPVADDDVFFGQTVKNARRLSFIVKPGCVLVSNQVAEQFNGDVISPFHVHTNPDISTIHPNEEAILTRIMDSVEQSAADPEFKVAQFAASTGMSKSQLYRKVKSLTGLSPIEFIKEYRLRTAATQIKKRAGTVSEIAYASGFGSPSYFSKCFLQRFHILPSDLAQKVG